MGIRPIHSGCAMGSRLMWPGALIGLLSTGVTKRPARRRSGKAQGARDRVNGQGQRSADVSRGAQSEGSLADGRHVRCFAQQFLSAKRPTTRS
jgi:hypothetical protein